MTDTEPMPRLVVGNAELGGGGKLKKRKGFLKPNFGVGPKPVRFDGSVGLSIAFLGLSHMVSACFVLCADYSLAGAPSAYIVIPSGRTSHAGY